MSPKDEPRPYLPLSTRAQEAVVAETKNPLLDILADLWHPESNPNGFFSVGIAENVLMHDVLLEYINKQLTLPAKYLTYNDGGAGSTRLKKATARFLNRHLSPFTPIQPHHLAITNGVSSAIEQLSWIFANPGDGILLGRPYYGQFIPDLAMRPAAKVVPVNFDDCNPFEPAAVEKYEQALLQFESQTSNKVRALVLCHPHNPLGRCYPTRTIVELMRLCQTYQIHLISDEIYALSTWENRIDRTPAPVKFQSVLSIDPTDIIDPGLTHILWGMSKDFGANGIRIGVIVSQANAGVHSALRGTSLYSYVSGLSDYIAANILEDDAFTDQYIEMNRQRLGDSYHFVAEYLQQHGLEYERGGNAGFFIWVNLGKKYLESRQKIHYDGPDLTQEIMDRLCSQKVFLASGNAFGSEKPGWFRIVTSHPTAYLAEALRRIELAVGN
ncbi:pyridoxal phosphate-dependent transferase [Aspergillus pseudotamarii]|uniref:Pyridoxal phosphate-dependent transferase n=1 Tax=Aspergillus pseudotamarii TaxID=132259 RepID=A0A5N6T3N1_ASPPS|nr:pyridoxal phosphate-dependent transferase [Aspergillus pseudotamarii]KAE8140916.1 pyridoxal phosphate-dependent transferase [Aspergillus pseudotamarii]